MTVAGDSPQSPLKPEERDPPKGFWGRVKGGLRQAVVPVVITTAITVPINGLVTAFMQERQVRLSREDQVERAGLREPPLGVILKAEGGACRLQNMDPHPLAEVEMLGRIDVVDPRANATGWVSTKVRDVNVAPHSGVVLQHLGDPDWACRNIGSVYSSCASGHCLVVVDCAVRVRREGESSRWVLTGPTLLLDPEQECKSVEQFHGPDGGWSEARMERIVELIAEGRARSRVLDDFMSALHTPDWRRE